MERIQSSLRSLHGIGSQASIYCPLATQLHKTPPYLSFDSTSQWETSALQMTGLETALLPSRLKNATDGYSLLVDMCQLFTAHSSRRTILQSSLSINNEEQHINGEDKTRQERSHDPLEGSSTQRLDISLFPHLSNIRSGTNAHQFSWLSVHRGGNVRVAQISAEAGLDDEPI